MPIGHNPVIGAAGWTVERVALLLKLNDGDLSCSQIAAELGGGLTRNAVIGKLNRMKVPKTRMAAVPARPRRPRVERTIKRIAGNRAVTAFELVPIPEPIADLEIPAEQRRSLLQLNEDTCRWPVGDPHCAGFFFCGAPPLTTSPYCGHHTQLGLNPDGRRAPRGYDTAPPRRRFGVNG